MEDRNLVYVPDVSEIYDFAYASLQRLPESFRAHLKNFIIEVQNFADSEILAELDMQDRYDLLGLYRGVPVALKKKVSNKEPDTIFLYRCPLIRHARENDDDVKALVNHVLINEIGHHFGCTAHEMERMHQQVKFSPEA